MDDKPQEVFVRNRNVSTRRARFVKDPSHNDMNDNTLTKVATVQTLLDADNVSLLSSSPLPRRQAHSRPSVEDILRSWTNPDLWDNFECNDDGWWILKALLEGTLLAVSDGSYMREKHPGACSGAFTLVFTKTGKEAQCSWADLKKLSDNYRGELLGTIGFLLVIRAVLSNVANRERVLQAEPPIVAQVWNDCKGVLFRGNNPKEDLTNDQAHADLICVLRRLVLELPIKVKFNHVRGHLDEHFDRTDLTIEENLNVEMDELAKRTLRRAIKHNSYIKCSFPTETLQIFVDGEKVIRSPTEALEDSVSQRAAISYYHDKNKISRDDFELVDWPALKRAMKEWPLLSGLFYTKILTGFCGVGHFLNKITDGEADASCSCCGHPDKTVDHMLKCSPTGRANLYESSVKKFEGCTISSRERNSDDGRLRLRDEDDERVLSPFRLSRG